MTSIALFHSVLGVRPGVNAAANLLRSHDTLFESLINTTDASLITTTRPERTQRTSGIPH